MTCTRKITQSMQSNTTTIVIYDNDYLQVSHCCITQLTVTMTKQVVGNNRVAQSTTCSQHSATVEFITKLSQFFNKFSCSLLYSFYRV